MGSSRIIIALLPGLLVSASLAFAHPQTKRNKGGVTMTSVLSLKQDGTGPALISGRPANRKEWPASFFSSSDGARCTATLVGPRALLLAAHCVGDNQPATITVLGRTYEGPCTHASGYPVNEGDPGDESKDYALCRMGEKETGKEVAGIVFETINKDPAKVKRKQLLRLTGYGCTQKGKASDGIYRIGEAEVIALPGDPKIDALPDAGANEPNSILTKGKTMICPGDSGGGCFLILSKSDVTKRALTCVNSRVGFSKGISYLSSTTTADGLAFIEQWIAKNDDQKVCGINFGGPSCR